MSDQNPDDGVAIVGLVGRFPGARDVDEFWQNLAAGVDSITRFQESELEPSRLEPAGIRSLPNYVRARGVLDDVDKFDAAFFGVTPRDASVMDPQQRVFLEAAWAALEDAGYGDAAGRAVGVYAGMGNPTYYLENVLPRRDVVESVGPFEAMILNEKDYLTTRVSYKLDLRGPSVSVHTACSTSLVAVCQACQALVAYQCDMALAGGVAINLPQRRGYLHVEGAILSPDGHCRPFDADAAGAVIGAGVGIVVLKRLADALEDGDTIRAVIRGWAINNDGSGKVSYTAPSVDGQAEVITTAQAFAGVDPRTISYVEAHGTGTPVGDPIEITALTKAFRTGTQDRGYCAIGSAKSNIGHLDAAAGVTGLIKTVLALERRQLPPTAHFRSPNPRIDFEASPFFVNAELRPWDAGSGTPRRAGVSAFGIGGTNAHVVVEEAPAAPAAEPARPEQLLVLSARTKTALDAATSNLAAHLRAHPELALADVSHTLRVGRKAFPIRRVLVARDAADAATVLAGQTPGRLFTGNAQRSAPSVLFLFPGQGAQQVGMAAGLYRAERVFRAELDACADALRPHLGLDIRTLVFAPPEQREQAERRLAETSVTQPVLFAVEYALARQWMEWGLSPAAMIGHSLGEYVAACLAGVFSRDVAAALVAARGRLMQAQPRGAMLAIRQPCAEVQPRLGQGVTISAVNSPEVTVVSGTEEAIRAFEATLVQEGVGCRVLATSHAFHSSLMDGALAPFREVLSRVKLAAPELRFISCLTGDWITPAQAVDPEYWVQQLRQPVRFSDGVHQLTRIENSVLLEVGPGHTLSGLVRQHHDRPAEQAVITSLGGEPDQDVSSVLEALGRLWISGVQPDWAAVHEGRRARRVPLPTYPFERKRHWLEPPAMGATEAAAASQPAEGRNDAEPEPAAPQSAVAAAGELTVAEQLVALLSTASGVPAAEIDPSWSFLELGFDSLLLIRTTGAIEKTFGVNVAFRQLFQAYPSPAALAKHIEAQLAKPRGTAAAAPPAAVPAPTPSSAPAVAAAPPVPGARLGRDAAGNPAWFVPDPDRPGKYLQLASK